MSDSFCSNPARGPRKTITHYLPPYSPDFNPIEPMWSKAKQHLRRLAARTKQTLINAIGKALMTITSADAAGWFRHARYRNTQV